MGGDNHTEDRPIADIGPCAIPPRHEHLQYQDGKGLCVDGHSLTAIAAEYGTPAYVYSLPRVLANYKRIHDAFTKALEPDTVLHVHFAMKSNACGAVLRALAAAGCGADCVSDGEVRKALKFGIPASRIVFAGVGKSYAELLYAVAQNVEWINVENEREIELIERAAVELGIDRRVNVALRMNPDIAASTHPSIATGHKYAKFGVPRSRVEAILAEAETLYPHCHIGAVHVHIGSQLGDTEATVAAVQAAVDVAKPHYPRVRHINIGGGFPVPYKAEQASLPLADAFAAAVAPLLKGFEVSLEPGRSI
jgi:diaminopimelate decarboxylase